MMSRVSSSCWSSGSRSHEADRFRKPLFDGRRHRPGPRDRGTGRAAQCTHLYRAERRFLPEFGIARGEAIAKMSELRRKGVRRIDLKIIASDPDVAAITKDVAAE
jgi:hypothetical protein